MATKSLAVQRRERLERGAALAASGAASRVARGRWHVEGSRGASYTVSTLEDPSGKERPVSCNCADYQRRGNELGTCKHMAAVTVQSKAHDAIDAASDLGALYVRTVQAVTLARGWKAAALLCLLDTIEVRERLAAPSTLTTAALAA